MPRYYPMSQYVIFVNNIEEIKSIPAFRWLIICTLKAISLKLL